MSHITVIRPQVGPQEVFLSSPADIAIYGGSAGGGKTWGLLLEPLRHTDNPGFGAVIFRRTSPQITNEGALWDEAGKMYPAIGAVPRIADLAYRFPSGVSVGFAHLQHEHTKLDWQGSQIPLICFDELTHFTASQFWYLLSRNRSMCGVRPYVRATCNPDADSWVAVLISWWIDQETGLPILSRAGVLRWFVRIGDTLVWADTPDDLPEQRAPDGQVIPPKSLTFIPAKLTDNAALMAADPGYYGNLMSLPFVERERLLGGNWKVRPAAGLYFQRAWCGIVDAVPAGMMICRGWDHAATPQVGSNDPDWTSGTLIGRTSDKRFFVMGQVWLRGTPHDVQTLIMNTASQDKTTYGNVAISIPQDPGQSGKSQAIDYVKMLAGYNVHTSIEARNLSSNTPTPSKQSAKVTRFSPFSAQAEAKNVSFLRGNWNTRLFDELEGFPEAKHDDSADSTSRAFNFLTAAPAPTRVVSFPLMGR